ncbi:MAG: ribokinase [Bacilli bacterium]|nr:ribokinase [Bacilli bacterium]
MTKSIAVIGSVNVDTTLYVKNFVKPGETIHSLDKKVAIGGKGMNQAIALKRAGADVTFFCSIGNDVEASFVKDCFKENNLKVVFDEVDCPTGSASILVDSNSQNEIIIFEGANGNKEPSYKQNPELLKGFDIIVLQNEIPQEINDWIINAFHKTHTIIYNPAPSRKVDVDVVYKVSYLTPNEVEICDITGLNESQSIDYLIEKGVQNLIITVGKDGVKYINKENNIQVPAFKVKAIDTVAAGDTFLGYFVSGIARGLSIEESLRLGNAGAGLSVTKYGAVPSIPYLCEVEEFLK